ncbi:Meiotically up-regulated gene 113 [Chryseobacterium soldanellicola]|uniref:Meiotically up-regulated gene 113 n=2 Tax=Chryseobacterium soldanellicola TaxID=311333 RepID=A0A1H0XM68_9FLAO|nr:Meiotically up-regulated gene 113 [Chryseobacterium soldanellicola]
MLLNNIVYFNFKTNLKHTMQSLLIILLICLTLYAFIKLNKIKKELAQKNAQIISLNQEINQLKSELLNYQSDKKSLNDKIQKLRSELSNLQIDKRTSDDKILQLKNHNDALSKYQDILNVQIECEYLLKKAERDGLKLREKANQELINAQENARESRKNIKEFVEKKQREIELLYENALNESRRILENAENKAETIGGDAYRSLREADEIAERIKAMKNVIKGYGNEYLIPSYTLLDSLAEDFSHKEAGENLKKLRQNNKIMIVNRQAGICEYMDEQRRVTAVDFVIDAYNGKVDSILSTVKKDNYGILKQKMEDAFQLVNFNGKAFRNARISEVYHNARLEELKWAVVAQELRSQEQEEQRQIREQIREEEKARREFERAIKEAEKEEQTLKKLIEKAESQVARATEEQKLIFQQKLEELQGKLEQAEEKNQRAISMAQQTRTGNVYVISNIGSFGEDVYKIGMTRRLEPLDRVRELGDASVPFEFDVHAMIYSADAPALERQLHKRFLKNQLNKINPRKEFFRLKINDVKNYMESMEIECKWTMIAEARQYRETLKLEEEMKNNKQLEAEWEHYQEIVDPVVYEEEVIEEI